MRIWFTALFLFIYLKKEYNGFEGDVHMKTNETLKVLEERRACRKFKPDMVD